MEALDVLYMDAYCSTIYGNGIVTKIQSIASSRLQSRIAFGRTIVSVHVRKKS